MKLCKNWNRTVILTCTKNNTKWYISHVIIIHFSIAMVKFNELVIKAVASAHDPQNIRTKEVEEAAQNVSALIILPMYHLLCDHYR